ncbi:MAG: ROK family protein, partial [Archangium sp.]
LGAFERVSVGFPGVVQDGVTMTAQNLHPTWQGFDLAGALAKATGRPVRVLNDAGVQGFGVIEGRGVEMVLTLGTGLGCALYVDGKYVPNLELAHHPFRHGKTYEEYVGNAALKRVGRKKWNKHVQRVLEQIEPIWNPRQLYLGGGNAKHIDFPLPPNVKLTENVAGLLGGFALWKDEPLPRCASTPLPRWSPWAVTARPSPPAASASPTFHPWCAWWCSSAASAPALECPTPGSAGQCAP